VRSTPDDATRSAAVSQRAHSRVEAGDGRRVVAEGLTAQPLDFFFPPPTLPAGALYPRAPHTERRRRRRARARDTGPRPDLAKTLHQVVQRDCVFWGGPGRVCTDLGRGGVRPCHPHTPQFGGRKAYQLGVVSGGTRRRPGVRHAHSRGALHGPTPSGKTIA